MGSPSYGLPIFKRWIKSHSRFALRLPQYYGLSTRQRDRLCSKFGADHRFCCGGVRMQKATPLGEQPQ